MCALGEFLLQPKRALAAKMQACTKLASVFSVVFVTVPSIEVAKSIGRDVVKSRLAACVNIVPQMTSIYEWQDKLQEDDEALLVMKTKTSQLDNLKDRILKLHPYDVPEFISLPIESGRCEQCEQKQLFINLISVNPILNGSAIKLDGKCRHHHNPNK